MVLFRHAMNFLFFVPTPLSSLGQYPLCRTLKRKNQSHLSALRLEAGENVEEYFLETLIITSSVRGVKVEELLGTDFPVSTQYDAEAEDCRPL
jgi:hypothetical protein